jgi:hypothetical protein
MIKTSLEHLPKAKQKQIFQIVEIIKEAAVPEKIIVTSYIQQTHLTVYGGVIRRLIFYVTKLNQILHTFMIGRQPTDLSNFHYSCPGNIHRILEPVQVIKLEQGHIQADMGRAYPIVIQDSCIKTGQFPHLFHTCTCGFQAALLFSNFSMSS